LIGPSLHQNAPKCKAMRHACVSSCVSDPAPRHRFPSPVASSVPCRSPLQGMRRSRNFLQSNWPARTPANQCSPRSSTKSPDRFREAHTPLSRPPPLQCRYTHVRFFSPAVSAASMRFTVATFGVFLPFSIRQMVSKRTPLRLANSRCDQPSA